jgi:hypothetical protein
MSRGHARHAAAAARTLEDENVGARLAGFDCGTDTCATKTHDDDIGLVAPAFDVAGFDDGVLTLAHEFAPTGLRAG